MKHSEKQYHQYFNHGGFGVAIVAVATCFDDKPFDWAAYIGGDSSHHEKDTVNNVARNGCKISAEWARVIFPQLEGVPYRN